MLLTSLAHKFSKLRDGLHLGKEQTDKFKAVGSHLDHETKQLDEDEQHQFASIFEEFKGVLAEFVEQSPHDPKLGELAQFVQSLLDSVLAYIEKKTDLQRVGRVEMEDFFKKFAKTQKALTDLAASIQRELDELKPALDARIAKALEFTSLMEKEDPSPKVATFNFDPRPASTLQNLFNLKKTLNSPREHSGRDRSRDETTTRSTKSREKTERTSDLEQQLVLEHMRNQVVVLQSEIERRDGTAG